MTWLRWISRLAWLNWRHLLIDETEGLVIGNGALMNGVAAVAVNNGCLHTEGLAYRPRQLVTSFEALPILIQKVKG